MKPKFFKPEFKEQLELAIERQRNDFAGNVAIHTLLNDATSFYAIATNPTRDLLSKNQAVGFATSKLKSAINKMNKVVADKNQAKLNSLSLLAEVNPQLFARKVAHANHSASLYNALVPTLVNEVGGVDNTTVELPLETLETVEQA